MGAAAVALAGIWAIAIPPRQDVVPDAVSLLERPEADDAAAGKLEAAAQGSHPAGRHAATPQPRAGRGRDGRPRAPGGV